MTNIHFLIDKVCLKHNSGRDHPERPSRVFSILKILKEYPEIITTYNSLSLPYINYSELFPLITSVHSKKMLTSLSNSQYKSSTYFNFDCITNNYTYNASLASVALTLQAGITSSPTTSYFVLTRPPGHHATDKDFMGFCFINNIAVAAKYLSLQNKKILIIDFDYHYGNGTANIFWTNPAVLYISIHADPTINYPHSGFIDEIGGKEGKGFNICIPLSFGSGNMDLIKAFNDIILPILYDFHPDIIGVSAGFDGFTDDPVGRGFLKYDSIGFHYVGYLLHNIAKTNNIPIFHVLEGGYYISVLPKLLISYISPWLYDMKFIDQPFDEDARKLGLNVKINKRNEHTFIIIKKILQPYWNF